MDHFHLWFRFSLLLFFHLGNQKLYRLIGNLINLLPYGADRNNRFGCNRGVIKTDDAVFLGQTAIVLNQKI